MTACTGSRLPGKFVAALAFKFTRKCQEVRGSVFHSAGSRAPGAVARPQQSPKSQLSADLSPDQNLLLPPVPPPTQWQLHPSRPSGQTARLRPPLFSSPHPVVSAPSGRDYSSPPQWARSLSIPASCQSLQWSWPLLASGCLFSGSGQGDTLTHIHWLPVCVDTRQ